MPAQESLNRALTTPVQVLVEGRTPEIFFREMVAHLGLKSRIQIRDYENIENLVPYLRTFTQLAGFIETVTGLGIIRDAENNLAHTAFQSVSDSLRVVNIIPPPQIGVVQPGDLKVGVYILPDCQSVGMLETLCLQAIAAHTAQAEALQCVDEYFACLQNHNLAWPTNMDKARVWAFLSGQMSADPQVGRAAQKKVWNWDSVAFARLRKFFIDLAAD
jgi:hypothetical protein